MKIRIWLFSLLPVLGCGPSAERERCYQAADDRAQERVDAECGESFSSCPAADSIMEEMQRAQEACP